MKNSVILIAITFCLLSCSKLVEKENEKSIFPLLSNKYFNQEPPGKTPKIFAPEIISTGMSEINACFSPDYQEFYYSIILPNRNFVIMKMNYDGEKWHQPEVAEFSGKYSDADPIITPDGNWLYFISRRPLDKKQKEKTDWDIWRMKRITNGWSEPERLEEPINSDQNDVYPSLTKNGTLYFGSDRKGNTGGRDIFSATKKGNSFNAPIALNQNINSNWEGDVFVSPEEEYIIFATFGRKSGSGLYISFRKNGDWTNPIKMVDGITITGREFCPIVSPDGNYFFFTSNRTKFSGGNDSTLTFDKIKKQYSDSFNLPQKGNNDIYWVSTEIIEDYRKKKN